MRRCVPSVAASLRQKSSHQKLDKLVHRGGISDCKTKVFFHWKLGRGRSRKDCKSTLLSNFHLNRDPNEEKISLSLISKWPYCCVINVGVLERVFNYSWRLISLLMQSNTLSIQSNGNGRRAAWKFVDVSTWADKHFWSLPSPRWIFFKWAKVISF